jgi:hypothetical protein
VRLHLMMVAEIEQGMVVFENGEKNDSSSLCLALS